MVAAATCCPWRGCGARRAVDYAIVGVVEKWDTPTPDLRVPAGGSCWHCGAAIAYCVQIRHTNTGEAHEIGTTCAERVGLDIAALKLMLADKYAAARAERSATRHRATHEDAARRDAAAGAEHGPHGTESRFRSGCHCDECETAAPHGLVRRHAEQSEIAARFHAGCRCLDCIDAVLVLDADRSRTVDSGHRIALLPVLVELDTGSVTTSAMRVKTRYGLRWKVDTRYGALWLSVAPKQRDTLARKGYVEATAPWLVDVIHGRTHRIHLLGEPIVDDWGTPIPHPLA